MSNQCTRPQNQQWITRNWYHNCRTYTQWVQWPLGTGINHRSQSLGINITTCVQLWDLHFISYPGQKHLDIGTSIGAGHRSQSLRIDTGVCHWIKRLARILRNKHRSRASKPITENRYHYWIHKLSLDHKLITENWCHRCHDWRWEPLGSTALNTTTTTTRINQLPETNTGNRSQYLENFSR